MTDFSYLIRTWYAENKRDLPWRHTTDPYKIWLSEIILQQTRVQQGMSYYFKFCDAFPDLMAMASASEEDVLNLWQGLGYYSRARNMHKTARHIAVHLNGVFPNSYDALIKLPGIGPYTAAAIASFAFGEPKSVVDGNVYRVLSRIFNCDLPIDKPNGQKFFQNLANELMDIEHAAEHNQAIMEFGALICTPKNSSCTSCVFNHKCEAFAASKVQLLPKKEGKIKIRKRTFHYFVARSEAGFLMCQREANDIWANMYEFPLIESENLDVNLVDRVRLIKQFTHKLTHQHLTIFFYDCPKDLAEKIAQRAIWIFEYELKNYPLPKVVERLFAEFYNLDTVFGLL